MKWESTYGTKRMGDHPNKAFGGTQYFVTRVVYPSLGTHVCFFTEMHLAPVHTLKIQ